MLPLSSTIKLKLLALVPQAALLGGIAWSRDSRYVYLQDFYSADQTIFRTRISDHRIEPVASLKQFARADASGGFSFPGLAPDDSPLASLIRVDSDIYALEVDLPR